MKWIIKDHVIKTGRRFAIIPRRIEYKNDIYMIWLEWYEVALTWTPSNLWAAPKWFDGYKITCRKPIFKSTNK